MADQAGTEVFELKMDRLTFVWVFEKKIKKNLKNLSSEILAFVFKETDLSTSMELEADTYDVVVIGTGLAESIAAA